MKYQSKASDWEIYVTVGHPHSHLPIVNKVSVYVDEEINQTPIQAAKLLRKKIADDPENYGYVKGTRFRPAQLYYEIYMKPHSQFPFAESTNSPHLYSPAALGEMVENLNKGTKAVVDSIEPMNTDIKDLNSFTKAIAEDPIGDSLLVKMWEEEMEPKQEYNPVDELLKEMQSESPDEDVINGLACSLFITSGGVVNTAQINEFEKYAPCKIYPVESDSFGWLIGEIAYNDKKFTFG